MAYENNTNFYDSIIANSYSANISGLISRIEDAHEAIRSKAIELGLKIPAGKRLTHNASGSSDIALTATHHILDTAAAINNIPINSHTSLTLVAGGSYTVPVGYNAIAYTISASGLTGLTPGTALASDILINKTAWVDGLQITGSMPDKSGDQLNVSYNSYKDLNNLDYLYFAIPETGKYTEGSKLKSDIRYYDASTVEIPVTITIGSTGETIATSSSKSFPEGYYSGPINIKAVYDSTSTTNKVINIDNTVGQLTKQSGTLTITSGYDYFASDASYSIKTGSITDVTKSVDSETGVVTFDGGLTTEGWISANVVKPTTYTPVEAVFSTDNITGKVTIKTAGWVKKDKDISGLAAGSATMTGPTQNTGSSAITIGSTSIGAGNYYMKLVKTAGYITADTVGIDLSRTTLSSNTLSSAGSGASTITNKYWRITASKGYNEEPLIQNLTVQDATYSKNTTTGVINVSKAGWIAAGNYGGLSAGSAEMTGPTLASSATTVGGVSISSGSYYMKLVKTAGYITEGTIGINLGRAIVTNQTSMSTSEGSLISSKKWEVVTSAGFNPESITTVLTVKGGTVNPNVTIGSDYSCTLGVTEGWIDDDVITLNINAQAQKYTIDIDDIVETDHTFVVEAAEGTLMKSLEINTELIYGRLAAI